MSLQSIAHCKLLVRDEKAHLLWAPCFFFLSQCFEREDGFQGFNLPLSCLCTQPFLPYILHTKTGSHRVLRLALNFEHSPGGPWNFDYPASPSWEAEVPSLWYPPSYFLGLNNQKVTDIRTNSLTWPEYILCQPVPVQKFISDWSTTFIHKMIFVCLFCFFWCLHFSFLQDKSSSISWLIQSLSIMVLSFWPLLQVHLYLGRSQAYICQHFKADTFMFILRYVAGTSEPALWPCRQHLTSCWQDEFKFTLICSSLDARLSSQRVNSFRNKKSTGPPSLGDFTPSHSDHCFFYPLQSH